MLACPDEGVWAYVGRGGELFASLFICRESIASQPASSFASCIARVKLSS
jgi:hypothetical protein